MRILLSNDDGFKALGIKSLREYLVNYAKIIIVAPTKNVSAVVVHYQ